VGIHRIVSGYVGSPTPQEDRAQATNGRMAGLEDLKRVGELRVHAVVPELKRDLVSVELDLLLVIFDGPLGVGEASVLAHVLAAFIEFAVTAPDLERMFNVTVHDYFPFFLGCAFPSRSAQVAEQQCLPRIDLSTLNGCG